MLRHLSYLWDSFVFEEHLQLERAISILVGSRAFLLFPFPQENFSPFLKPLTDLIPQAFWGLFSLAIAVALFTATFRGSGLRNLKLRYYLLYVVGAYWLLLSYIYLIGSTRAYGGWFFLISCSLPLAGITRLFSIMKEVNSPSILNNIERGEL